MLILEFINAYKKYRNSIYRKSIIFQIIVLVTKYIVYIVKIETLQLPTNYHSFYYFFWQIDAHIVFALDLFVKLLLKSSVNCTAFFAASFSEMKWLYKFKAFFFFKSLFLYHGDECCSENYIGNSNLFFFFFFKAADYKYYIYISI